MYEAFFELTARPFPSTPDPDAYFPAAGHQEARNVLASGWKEGEAFGMLVGAPGTGKTLLCRQLIATAEPSHALVFLGGLNDESVEAMLLAMLHDVSLPVEAQSAQRLRLTLTDFLLDRFSSGGKTTVFIDEAQNLSPAQLEELRLLTNLEGRHQKAVQILLFGQDRLLTTLQDDALAALRQRISVYARLSPLTDDEVTEYVRAHISRVGGSADSMFTASAMSEICEFSAGIPRRINQIGHRALALAYANHSGTIDGEFIQMAAGQLFLVKPTDRIEHHHLPSPGAPRRIYNDLAFQDSRPLESQGVVAPIADSPQMTVLEVGADDDWESTADSESASEVAAGRQPADPTTDGGATDAPRSRWRDEFQPRI